MREMTLPIDLPPVLTDGVIVLDGHTVADAEAHAALEDDEMMRRFDAPRRGTLEEIRASMQRWIDAWAAGGPDLTFAMRDGAGGTLMGGCEVRFVAADCAHISYWTYPQFRGRGLGAQATALLCAAISAVDGIAKIEAHIDADNVSSRRVVEKNGFALDGTVVDDAFTGEKITRVRYVRQVVR